MMPTFTGMDVPEKLLALVSRYALQSDAVRATPVQVTIFDTVSRGLAYYLIRIIPAILRVLSRSFTVSHPDRNLPIMRRTSPEEEERIQHAT
jgi:hypothetical protein